MFGNVSAAQMQKTNVCATIACTTQHATDCAVKIIVWKLLVWWGWSVTLESNEITL